MIGIVADIDDDVCCEAVAICCAFVELLIQDDFGGSGLFGTAEDYLKLLRSILRNDGKLLTEQSVDLMFTPSLSTASRASLHNNLSAPDLAKIMIPGEPVVGTEGAGD